MRIDFGTRLQRVARLLRVHAKCKLVAGGPATVVIAHSGQAGVIRLPGWCVQG